MSRPTQSQRPHDRIGSAAAPSSADHGRWITGVSLVGGAVVLWGLLSLVGLFLTHGMTPRGGQPFDERADAWFAAHRTSLLNSVSHVGSQLGNTLAVIAVTVVAMLLLRWSFGRWYESLVLLTAIVGELIIFLAVTVTVHRPRPPVSHLDASPPTSSFPSGHTMASVVLYGSLALLLWRAYGARWWTDVIGVVLFCVPVFVGLSRLYRGMHYPGDVVAGAVGGAIWLAIVFSVLSGRRRGGAALPVETRRGSHVH